MRWRVGSVLALVGAMFFIDSARAVEKVIRKNGITLTGKIVEYDERGVRIQLESGETTLVDADQIREVVAERDPAVQPGKTALAEGRFDDALAEFDQALRREQRGWAQHQIRADQIAALAGAGRWEESARLFLSVARGRQDAEVMALAPLVWMPDQQVDAAARSAAQRWLKDPDPMARLIGASWLLEDSGDGPALETLEVLKTLPDQRIGLLARAQAFRVEGKRADDAARERFATLLDRLPSPVRHGPQYVLGLSLAEAGQPADAALALLWIEYVCGGPYSLAADALYRAAENCQRAGLNDDARILYRELLERYPRNPRGAEAETQLQRLGDGDKGKN